ncbi:MAG: hypothetical protein HOL29_07955 [Euryarchaeota archaeon]|mgnify:FL=1|jgi:hypothetical protein|nr:hypothetical protein [Euryarchaeota archaeon]MBT5454771.1 hypothetical protein [Euryarchaeota archaeon]
MPRIDRRITLMALFMVSIVSTGYYLNIVTYENTLGTQNTLTVNTGTSTESTEDVLLDLSFAKGGENLSWNSVQLELNVEENTYPCMVGGMSSVVQDNGTVLSKLNADGKTFTINIDTNGEETQYLDLHTMSVSNESSFSLSFLQTDIFLGEGRKGIAVEGDFSQIKADEGYVLDEDDEERLEWYSYDFSVHRIIPDSEVYLIEDRGVMFKVQFLNYYNSDGAPRHISLLAAPLGNSSIPALTDESMIQIAPCTVLDDGDGVWGADEVISLQENGFSICEGECTVTVVALFEEKRIDGTDTTYSLG